MGGCVGYLYILIHLPVGGGCDYFLCPQTDGPEGELFRLGRERQVLVLQMEALRREKQEADRDLEVQHLLHLQQLHSLREESVQVGLGCKHLRSLREESVQVGLG